MTTTTTNARKIVWNRSTWFTRAFGWESLMEAEIDGAFVQIRIMYAFNSKRISDVIVVANGTETAVPVAYGKGAAAIAAAKRLVESTNVGGR